MKVLALFLVLLATFAFADDCGCCNRGCKPAYKQSVNLLDAQFKETDKAFNSKGFLTLEDVLARGYYAPTSMCMAHGPPATDASGHTNHVFQPGTTTVYGSRGCAELQRNFYNLFTLDPHFTSTNTTWINIEHYKPVPQHTIGDMMSIASTVKFTFAGPLIAWAHAQAQYTIHQDDDFCGPVSMPTVDWIIFNVRYADPADFFSYPPVA